ncbi:DUF6412 domain-containing protein [Nonomuraea sp. NPDC046570]|uniref:DUF6412 domain-containing protein n=1 Tax=Nonomuraea sp. NPDC046570 TaxID=3155255 RepID=UPI0033F03CAA
MFEFALAMLANPAGVVAVTAMTGLGVLLLAAWACRLSLAVEGEAPRYPLVYARRTAFQRQRDPDAAGRPRPRAPSLSPASG